MNDYILENKESLIEEQYNTIIDWAKKNFSKFSEWFFKGLTKREKIMLDNLLSTRRFVTKKEEFAVKYIALKSLLFSNHHTFILIEDEEKIKEINKKFLKVEGRFLNLMCFLLNAFKKEFITTDDLTTMLKNTHKISNSFGEFVFLNGSSVKFANPNEFNKMVGIRSNLNVYFDTDNLDPIIFPLTLPFITLLDKKTMGDFHNQVLFIIKENT